MEKNLVDQAAREVLRGLAVDFTSRELALVIRMRISQIQSRADVGLYEYQKEGVTLYQLNRIF